MSRLPPHRAQGAEVAMGPERPGQKAKAHQLLQPLTVEHVRFAPRNVFDVAGVHQIHREPARLQQLEQRNPVHSGGLHRHRLHATGGQPVGQPMKVLGKARKPPHRRIIPIRRHRHKMAGGADIDAGGVGMGQFEHALAGSHGLLHYPKWESPPLRERRQRSHPSLRSSLKRDVRSPELTNVADVTQDHANKRVRAHH